MMIVILGGGRRREMCLTIDGAVESLQSINEAILNIATALGTTFDSVEAAFERLASYHQIDVEALQRYIFRLKEKIDFEYSDCIIENEVECNWPPNPCKCKAGHSSRPFANPPYWHRIRSFCVRNNHH